MASSPKFRLVPHTYADMTAPDLEFALNLERSVWEAAVRGDAVADEKLLHENFIGVYSTGLLSRVQHAGQLKAGPLISEFKLHEARLTVVQSDIVMLTYRAEFRRLRSQIESLPEQLYVSSLWRRFPEGWLNLFSQDTSVA